MEITNLEIGDVIAKDNCISIMWSANIGFGEYTICKHEDKWYLYTENMDINTDKSFGEQLLKKFLSQSEVLE